MFTKISVLIPTRKRERRLETLLRSYFQTTGNSDDVELVFRVDDDDPGTRNYLLGQHFHGAFLVGPRYGGYASMPTFFNELAGLSTGDVLMCGNDDMAFRTPEWPRLILDEANKYPDGIFDIGVSTDNETHYPFSIVSRQLVHTLGFLWDPRIFWGDIFLRDLAARFGRDVMLPSVRIDHDWAGNNPDEVFLEGDKNITMRDPTYWSGTHANAVKEAEARVREKWLTSASLF